MKKFNYNKSFLLFLPGLLGLLFRLFKLESPILGVHSWRQADTAAMARHFALENTPIWLPQIDWSGSGKGFIECEFPLFPYLVGQAYKLFGIHEFIGRSFSIIFSVITIYLIIRIGSYIFDDLSGWWGGLFFALLPLNIYYGRAFQAESFLLLLSAFSIERLIAWKHKRNKLSLILVWISFSLACLIKLLPFVWLGVPLFLIYIEYKPDQIEFRYPHLIKHSIKAICEPNFWIFAMSTSLICFLWFYYSYRLGQSSGLSFFLWGAETDRVGAEMLLDLNVWLNLALRVLLRNLSLFGFLFLAIGFVNSPKNPRLIILNGGLLSIFICTLLSFRSSTIHEYYQLPLQLYFCPLMGKGVQCLLVNSRSFGFSKEVVFALISLISLTSFLILHFDYYLVERNQEKIWMPLAYEIRDKVRIEDKIVSVTGLDPTLLNLSRRQGWLTKIEYVDRKNLLYWHNEGASHIVGSLNWVELYIPATKDNFSNTFYKYICEKTQYDYCPKPPNYTYLIPIKDLI